MVRYARRLIRKCISRHRHRHNTYAPLLCLCVLPVSTYLLMFDDYPASTPHCGPWSVFPMINQGQVSLTKKQVWWPLVLAIWSRNRNGKYYEVATSNVSSVVYSIFRRFPARFLARLLVIGSSQPFHPQKHRTGWGPHGFTCYDCWTQFRTDHNQFLPICYQAEL